METTIKKLNQYKISRDRLTYLGGSVNETEYSAMGSLTGEEFHLPSIKGNDRIIVCDDGQMNILAGNGEKYLSSNVPHITSVDGKCTFLLYGNKFGSVSVYDTELYTVTVTCDMFEIYKNSDNVLVGRLNGDGTYSYNIYQSRNKTLLFTSDNWVNEIDTSSGGDGCFTFRSRNGRYGIYSMKENGIIMHDCDFAYPYDSKKNGTVFLQDGKLMFIDAQGTISEKPF